MTKTLSKISPVLKLTWNEIFKLRNDLKTRFEYELPKYYLSNTIHNKDNNIIVRCIKDDLYNIGTYHIESSNIHREDKFFYLFDISFDFPISEEISNCGVESIFKGIDFSFILNLPNILRYQEYTMRFVEKAPNYALLEYNYRNCGDGEYDFEVSVLGYYDNDFVFNELTNQYLYNDYFINKFEELIVGKEMKVLDTEKILILLDSEKYNPDDNLYNRLELNKLYRLLEFRKESDNYIKIFKTKYSVLISDSLCKAWYPLHIFIPADDIIQREYKLREIIK